ncbi:MAG: single-stranded DNA-binding protein [bacterium]|nr:single-stranded DNA-binding protein [bacterium]
MNLNKVLLIGNLTRDPEVRTTPSGQTVTTLGIATNRVWNNQQTGQKEQHVEFHNVVCWAKLGEVVGQYLVKGQSVYVEGRLQTRSWQDQKSGEKRYRTEIVAENVQFGPKPGGTAGPYRQPAGSETQSSGDGANERPEAVQETDLPVIQEDEPEIEVKDIPF